MTSKIPVHVTYTGGDTDGLSDFLPTSESIQVDYGLTMATGAVISVGAEGTWGWKSVYKELIPKGNGANNPSWVTIRDGLIGLGFVGSGSSMTEVWSNIVMPKDYVAGTNIYLKTCLTNPAASPSTNNFRMQWEYAIVRDDDLQAVPATTIVGTTKACNATRYQMMEVLSPAISGATGSGGSPIYKESIVILRMFRDAAHSDDTNTDTLVTPVVGIYYQANIFATASY
jgi:hypothetical protein